MAHFALTIFLSAFLLFQVQPLIGKIVLPWFGGTPAVWNTCMVFFQVLLLAGYAYAHWSIEHLRPRRQGLVHVSMLAVAVAVTAPSIMPSATLAPDGTQSPTLLILAVLALSVGLPYFTLSATGSLVQAWFARLHPGRSPYPLYALSNAGSLLGLLTFPFVVEPNLGSGTQAFAWFWGYLVFAGACSLLAVRAGRRAAPPRIETVTGPTSEPAPTPSAGLRVLWVALAACGSTMLLATTNQMALDVASVPFLWVLPLALYLLSFVLCFSSERRYPRVLFYPAFAASIVAVLALMLAGPGVALPVQVGVYCVALFVFVMVCHGELYRLRPDPRHLTSFYLMLSLGGAIGGVFVGLIAPNVFDQYYELHLCLLVTPALVFYAFVRDPRLELGRRGLLVIAALATVVTLAVVSYVGFAHPEQLRTMSWACVFLAFMLAYAFVHALRGASSRAARLLPLAALGALGVNLEQEIAYRDEGAIEISRGFFGMLRVRDRYLDDPLERQRVLYHGAINHGFQYLAPERRRWHTSYFGPESGVGLALVRHPRRLAGDPMRIGVLGLGGGTLLTYGQAGDAIRIYEIDPEVERFSRRYFTYFDDTPAKTEVVIGDGRLSLEREPDQRYDVLILDAFSSDSIPMHLLTREAFQTYRRHLAPDGILAANMSNRHVDIRPVLARHGEELGLEMIYVPNWDDDARGVYGASWGLLTSNAAFLADDVVETLRRRDGTRPPPDFRTWTDDATNLLAVLKWRRDEPAE